MKYIIFLFLFPCLSLAKQVPLQLDTKLKRQYVYLLNQAADFHKAITKKDKKAVQNEIKETQEIITGLYRGIASVSEFHHKIHSHKLLKSIEERLELIQNAQFKNTRSEQKNFKKLFNSFFELAQVYNLTPEMKDKIYYCSRDKSLWFQKSGKTNNPINSTLKNCGQSIL